jgi:hypothetical protein
MPESISEAALRAGPGPSSRRPVLNAHQQHPVLGRTDAGGSAVHLGARLWWFMIAS